MPKKKALKPQESSTQEVGPPTKRVTPNLREMRSQYDASANKRPTLLVKTDDKGKIFSHIRQKWLLETPEERVRQAFVVTLHNEYGFALEQMDEELHVAGRGSARARADAVLWRTPQDKIDRKAPLIVAECKADNVTIKAPDYAQGEAYALYTNAPFFVTHNNRETRFWRTRKDLLPGHCEEIENIPHAHASDKQIEELIAKLKTFKEDEFADLLHSCHNVIRNREHLDPAAAFDEIAKVLFVKVWVEREMKTKRRRVNLFTAEYLDEQLGTHPLNDLFQRTKEAFSDDRIVRLSSRALVAWWKDVERWSVGSFVETIWGWPENVIRPLSAALTRKVVDVERDSRQAGDLRLVTLHFDGEMEPRNDNAGDSFKGRLFYADPGDVIYSKIDVRNGAIGIIPEEMGRACVSSEYPVYAVDPTVAEARYVKLLFRTDVFLRKINSMISGASGRKRVQPSDLETVNVPLPPLPVQQKIVAAWDAARNFGSTTAAQIERLERDIEARFLADLGLQTHRIIQRPKAFTSSWSALNRWGVEIAWRERQQSSKYKYATRPLSEICRTGTGGTPSRKRLEYFGGGIPWVKTTEVRNNIITTTDESLTEQGLANCQAKLYPVGSIIMAMYGQGATRGRTAKLGIKAATNQACLVMTDFDKALLPDFVWFYLRVRYHDLRALASGNNQPNLSAELVRAFPIPIPPESVQRKLIEMVETGRVEIARLKADAKARADVSKEDVEAMILGTRPA